MVHPFGIYSYFLVLNIYCAAFIRSFRNDVIELSLPKFRELSEINGNIYGESFLYFAGILFISYILLIPFIVRRYYRQSGNLFLFRKCSIVFQLIICILFIFCVSILMKQLNHLANGDIGWERKNTAVLRQYVSPESYAVVSAEIIRCHVL